jgi:hypothetical protein
MAEESLARLKEQAKQRYMPPFYMAEIDIGLEEKEQALKYLEMAYADHSCWMIFLKVDPRFDPTLPGTSCAACISHPDRVALPLNTARTLRDPVPARRGRHCRLLGGARDDLIRFTQGG